MILGRKAQQSELTDEEVERIAKEVSDKSAISPSPAVSTFLSTRDSTAAELENLALNATGPFADALGSLASFTRGEWPEDDELANIKKLGGDLAELQRVQDEASADALLRVAEAESARAQMANDMSRFIAAASATDDSAAGRLHARVEGLEVMLRNIQVKQERAGNNGSAPAGTGGHGDSSNLTNALRARVSRLEAENATLRTRLEGVEGQLAHIERILEAASAFAAEDRR